MSVSSTPAIPAATSQLDLTIPQIYIKLYKGEIVKLAVDKLTSSYLRNSVATYKYREESRMQNLGIAVPRTILTSTYDSISNELTLAIVDTVKRKPRTFQLVAPTVTDDTPNTGNNNG